MIEDRLCKNKAYFFCFESFVSVFDGCHFKQVNTKLNKKASLKDET